MDQRHILGQIELRYAGLDLLAAHRHEVDVIVEVVRESDDLRLSERQPYAFDYHWCGLVTTGRGGFYAIASILFDGTLAAHGETKRVPLP
jgi:hypothetical protein